MLRKTVLWIVLVLAAVVFIAALGRAQAPPEERITPYTAGSQFWARAAGDGGAEVIYVWREAANVRAMTPDGRIWIVPQTGCGPSGCTKGEPEIVRGADGTYLIAWSDWTGLHAGWCGEHGYMGAQARLCTVHGPLGDEFNLVPNCYTAWRPMVWWRPGGGWGGTVTGDWNENTYISLLAANAAFIVSAMQVNGPYGSGASQNYADGVWTPEGDVIAWRDCGPAHPPAGCGIVVRLVRFDRTLAEERALAPQVAGEQREVRLVAWQRGLWLVWTQQIGGSYEVYALRATHAGIPVGPAVQVNVQTVGTQYDPELAVDNAGTAWVVWHDRAAPCVWLRGIAASGEPLTEPIRVNAYPLGSVPGEVGRATPAIRILSSGELEIVWGGASQVAGGNVDVYRRAGYWWDL